MTRRRKAPHALPRWSAAAGRLSNFLWSDECDGGINLSVNLGSLLVPGRNCWRIEPAKRLAFLIDAAAYFAAVRSAIAQAKRTVFILGWDFDSRIRLVPGARDGYPERLGDFLKEVVKRQRNLHMYVLSWDFAIVFAKDREWMPLYKLGWRNHPHPRLSFRLDDKHPLGGSHHQKVVVVDDAVAFVGGIDLTHGRGIRRSIVGMNRTGLMLRAGNRGRTTTSRR